MLFATKIDHNGLTGLMLAAKNDSKKVVQFLLDKETLCTDFDGKTALMHAAEHNHLQIIRMLIPYELCVRDHYNNLALDYCCSTEARFLLRHERFNYDMSLAFMERLEVKLYEME